MYYAMRLYAQLPFPVAASYFRGRTEATEAVRRRQALKATYPKLFTGTLGLHYPIV